MTAEAPDHTPVGGQLDGEAARWCSAMHGTDAESHRPEFEAWLRRGALHRQAYNRMEEIYLLGSRLPPRLLAPERPTRRRLPVALTGTAAALALGAVALQSLHRRDRDTEVAVLGQRVQLRLSTLRVSSEAFRLADGSVVTLAPDSEVAVNYDARARRVRLERGRGRFDVARQGRPFLVEVGGAVVEADDDIFDVALLPASAFSVQVVAGSVDVSRPDGVAGLPVRRVAIGQAATFDAERRDGTPTTNGPEAAEEQTTTVGELVALANKRAGAGPRLKIDDPALQGVRLGGEFRVHDPDVVARRLATMLDLDVEHRPNLIVLRRRTAR